MELSETTKKWQKLSRRVLLIGIAVSIAVCIAMFVFLGAFMNAQSLSTMTEAGEMFMSGIGRQYTLRYDAVLEQRTDMVESLCKTWLKPQGDVDEDGLKNAAAASGFTYLAYMGNDGTIQTLYGYAGEDTDPEVITSGKVSVTPVDSQPFVQSLLAEQIKISIATSGDLAESKPDVVLIGVPTADRPEHKALIAGIKNTTIAGMLADKNTDGSDSNRFDTHIIRSNGSLVMSTVSHTGGHDDFFGYVINELGIETHEQAEQLLDQMIHAAEPANTTHDTAFYSSVVTSNTGRKHIYCEKLSNSEWFLVTVMDYSDLDGIADELSNTWTTFAIITCAVVLVLMFAIFVVYYYVNHKNLEHLEKARISAESANKAKSEFLSNMSHDIRTPMNAIVGMTSIAAASIDDKEKVASCLKKITLSSRHLLGLINDVLDMTKIESGRMTLSMEQISLSEAIEGISTIIQPQIKIKKQHFDIYVHDIASEYVYCDSVRLNQVLLNLLSNAYKFTPENGNIELAIYQEESPLGDSFVKTHITVKDNGIGMSEEFQKKIFDSFTREDRTRVKKTEGTGLGMSITKYIVDAMHGTIEVFSKQGEGTTFHVAIDLEKADVAEVDMQLPNWRMLVVDDDQTLCDTAVESLASIGVNADSALDGETAIKLLVDAQSQNKPYDVVLMDWKLPGIDGIETAKQLRTQLGENIPILLISAYDWAEIEDDARKAGVNGFIAKPLFKSTLYHGLKQFTEAVASEKTEDTQPEDVSLEGKRILVAEDNDLNWEIANMLLTEAGLICDHAENGEKCIDMLLAAKPGTYDAILMDLRMPVMDGIETAKIIRSTHHKDHNIPIIAMTADAFSEDVAKCIASGMNAHISKPIDIELVKETLIKFICKKD